MLNQEQYRARRAEQQQQKLTTEKYNTYAMLILNVLLPLKTYNMYVVAISIIILIYTIFESRILSNIYYESMVKISDMLTSEDEKQYSNHNKAYDLLINKINNIATIWWYLQITLTIINILLYYFL